MTNLTWRIGDFTITKVVETEGAGPNGGSESALADAWPEAVVDIPWLIPDFATAEGHLCMSVHALLIETPGKRLIVDTCIGNDKTRALPHFDHLRADTSTLVIGTHFGGPTAGRLMRGNDGYELSV